MRQLSNEQLSLVNKMAQDALWRLGNLSWMLEPAQLLFYNQSKTCKSKTFVTEAARRIGKTHGHACIAIELALKNPGCRVNWCQDSAKSIRDSAVPLFEKICQNAPEECKGVFNNSRSTFEFPNGAYIYLFGANTQKDADRSRGGDDPIASFIDEASFTVWLEYVYSSLLKPAMKRVKRQGHYGMVFLCSSTPYIPTHYFRKLADINSKKDSYIKLNIYHSSNAEAYIAEDAADLGLTVDQFMATTEFKREFLCESVVDENYVVFHEFAHHPDIVQEHPRPQGFSKYIPRIMALDLGMSDPTAFLFGYTDYKAHKIVIEHEYLIQKANNTSDLVQAIRTQEEFIWPNIINENTIRRVIDDHTGREIGNILAMSGLLLQKAQKDNRDASIKNVRALIASGTLIIHPRCVHLQEQLLTATWTKNHDDFAQDKNGHADLCAALMYFVRACDLSHDPYPINWDYTTQDVRSPHHPLSIRNPDQLIGRGIQGAFEALHKKPKRPGMH